MVILFMVVSLTLFVVLLLIFGFLRFLQRTHPAHCQCDAHVDAVAAPTSSSQCLEQSEYSQHTSDTTIISSQCSICHQPTAQQIPEAHFSRQPGDNPEVSNVINVSGSGTTASRVTTVTGDEPPPPYISATPSRSNMDYATTGQNV